MSFRLKLKDIETSYIPPSIEHRNLYLKKQEAHLEIYRHLIYVDIHLEKPLLTAEERLEIFSHLMKHYPKTVGDFIIGLTDVFRFVKEKEVLLRTFDMIVRDSTFPSDSRLKLISSIKCYGYFPESHELYKFFSMDTTADPLQRMEACKIVYAAAIPEERVLVQECIIELVSPESDRKVDDRLSPFENSSISSKRRFDLITSFFSRAGVKSALSSRTLISSYDEELLSGVLVSFFYEERNETREIILAGGMLLQMDIPLPEKESICNVLLDIAKDDRHQENARGDAADFVKNHAPSEKYAQEADHLLKEVIGFANIKNATTFIGRQRIIYNNSQNVHNDKTFERVIEFLQGTSVCTDQMIISTIEEVRNLVRQKITEKSKQLRTLKALHRIDIDTTTFTSKKITLADTLVNVWKVISDTKDETEKNLLTELLLEELYEMGDTCTSGHSIRLVNVLSARTGAEAVVKISYHDQIVANVAGRVNKLLSDADELTKESISIAFMPDADEEALVIAKNWRDSRLPLVHGELYEEFVVGGFVSSQEFEAAYQEATKAWGF